MSSLTPFFQFRRCRGRDRYTRLGSLPHSANNADVTRAPRKSRNMPGLLRSPNAAEKSAGFTGACSALNSYVRPLSNGPLKRFLVPSGRAPIIASNVARGARIRLRSAPGLSSGSAFSIVVGRAAHRMTNPLI